jgi:inhibitor of KinA sporulation pathway (predicted exonuclease)/transcription elongation factor Elf1
VADVLFFLIAYQWFLCYNTNTAFDAFCEEVSAVAMIVIDLEWNTVFYNEPDGTRRHFDEIIQIGAVRLMTCCHPGEQFNAYVRNRSGHLSPCISEMVHLTDEDLAQAEDFPTVAQRFLDWCGENPRFFTWSNSDIPVLRQNFLRYGLDSSKIKRAYNVQFAYSVLRCGSTSAVALYKAVEECGLKQDEPFHSAVNDAVYTARIMELLWEQFGGKTRESYLYSQMQKFRTAKKPPVRPTAPVPVALQSTDSFDEWAQSPWKYSRSRQHKKLSCNTHRKAYFRQTSSHTFTCPVCNRGMSSQQKWLAIQENRYAMKTHCSHHGAYYALMRLRRKNPYLWEGVIDLYQQQDAPLLAEWIEHSPQEGE